MLLKSDKNIKNKNKMVKKLNLHKNKFLFNLKNYLENAQYQNIIYWLTDDSFVIKDLYRLITVGGPFKTEESFFRNVLEYEFTKKKCDDKYILSHTKFKRGLTAGEIRKIEKRKKKVGRGNFHKKLKRKLLSKLKDEKEFIKLEKELDEFKNFRKKILLKKLILLITKNILNIYLFETACFKIFDGDLKTVLYLIRNYLHEIINDKEKLMTFINTKKKEKEKEANNNRTYNNNISNPTNLDISNYLKKMEMSGVEKNVYNLEPFKSTGNEKCINNYNNYNNFTNNECNKTIEHTF